MAVRRKNEQPRSKLRGIEHPSLNSFRGKPRGIEPEEIELRHWRSDRGLSFVHSISSTPRLGPRRSLFGYANGRLHMVHS